MNTYFMQLCNANKKCIFDWLIISAQINFFLYIGVIKFTICLLYHLGELVFDVFILHIMDLPCMLLKLYSFFQANNVFESFGLNYITDSSLALLTSLHQSTSCEAFEFHFLRDKKSAREVQWRDCLLSVIRPAANYTILNWVAFSTALLLCHWGLLHILNLIVGMFENCQTPLPETASHWFVSPHPPPRGHAWYSCIA